jgi:hypothetical protein
MWTSTQHLSTIQATPIAPAQERPPTFTLKFSPLPWSLFAPPDKDADEMYGVQREHAELCKVQAPPAAVPLLLGREQQSGRYRCRAGDGRDRGDFLPTFQALLRIQVSSHPVFTVYRPTSHQCWIFCGYPAGQMANT